MPGRSGIKIGTRVVHGPILARFWVSAPPTPYFLSTAHLTLSFEFVTTRHH